MEPRTYEPTVSRHEVLCASGATAVSALVQPGEKKNPFCVRPAWHIMTPYAQTTLPAE